MPSWFAKLPQTMSDRGYKAGNRNQAPCEERGSASGEARAARVLIVEDEILVAFDLKITLEDFGYEVCGIAATADEAVALAEAARPDAILMDISLRGPRDGISAAIQIREISDVAILFVSAHVDLRARERAEPARPVGFVGKPYSAAELGRALELALNDDALH